MGTLHKAQNAQCTWRSPQFNSIQFICCTAYTQYLHKLLALPQVVQQEIIETTILSYKPIANQKAAGDHWGFGGEAPSCPLEVRGCIF